MRARPQLDHGVRLRADARDASPFAHHVLRLANPGAFPGEQLVDESVAEARDHLQVGATHDGSHHWREGGVGAIELTGHERLGDGGAAIDVQQAVGVKTVLLEQPVLLRRP